MFTILILGSLLLFSLIWFTLSKISKRSKDSERSSGRMLHIILCISTLILIVQDYIFKEIPYNGSIIATFIAVFIMTTIPDPSAHMKKK